MNDAFEKVIQNESKRLYGLCFRLTGNAPDAEDLCQDALARALKSFDGFEGRSQISTWLHRIAMNAWKNKIRSKKRVTIFGFYRSEETSMSNDDAPAFDPKGNDPPPESSMERSESQQLLQDGLMSLDKEEREIIVLRDLEEKSYDELAGVLNIPLGTVKSRLARAREALRLRLSPLLKAEALRLAKASSGRGDLS